MATIKEKGKLTEYSLMPRRTLYVAVYKMPGGSYFSYSDENKSALIEYLQKAYGYTDIRIYEIDLEDRYK